MTKTARTITACIALLLVATHVAQDRSSVERSTEMLLGLRTCQYHVRTSELRTARDWYARTLGIEPYFDEPFYVGFNVQGFELGLVPDDENAGKSGSVFTYWGVSKIEPDLDRLLENGAKKDGEIQKLRFQE